MSHSCAHCGFENDPTRVYCHNCGEKLERTSEAAPTALPGGFTPPQVRSASRKRISLGALIGLWFGRFYALVKLAVFAALVLMIVQAFRAPDGWPEPVAPDENRTELLTEIMQTAAKSKGSVAFKFSADDVARWFATTVHFKEAQGALALRPVNAHALPGDGVLRVGIKTMLPVGEVPLFFSAEYKPVRKPGGYTLEPTGYAIGRLILPPYLGLPAQAQFKGLADALSPPLALLAKASDIKVEPDAVSIRWSGGAR